MEQKPIIGREALGVLIVGAVLAAVFGITWQIDPTACAVVMFELPYLAGIFLAGVAIGYGPVRLLWKSLPAGQQIVTASAVGLGLLSLGVMGLGLMGLLHVRILWLILIGVPAVVGLVLMVRRFQQPQIGEAVVFEAGRFWMVLLAGLIPFLVIVLLCAAIPPGVLWSAEGCGYDVLEYHLQVPKEWFQAGNIHFLGHNVYASFPFNAEMLYLLAMCLKGDAFQAVYLAQLIHVGMAVLFVASVWLFARPWGYKAASVATVVAGTCAWLTYLGPLAYVEMGMLFTGVVAMGLALRIRDQENPSAVPNGVLLGILLGLCGGYKYTALVMIAAPVILVALILWLWKVKFVKALVGALAAGIVCLALISPYLLRNFAWTGNPVFPLAYSWFGGRGWDPDMAARWAKGHQPREDEKPVKARLEKLYWAGFRNVAVDAFLTERYRARGEFDRAKAVFEPLPIMDLPQFGLAVLVLPWLVFLTRRQRLEDWLLALAFVLMTAVWLFGTHLQARFLVPWLIVLPLLAGRSASAFGDTSRFSIGIILIAAVVVGAVGLNFNDTYRRYLRHTYANGQPIPWFGQEKAFLAGQVPGWEYLETVNKTPAAKTLMLGDVRPFYVQGPVLYWTVFNRNEFIQKLEHGTHEAKNYIAAIRPDYIYVDWGEVNRLSRTYGFDPALKPSSIQYLSSPDRFSVRRTAEWEPFLETPYGRVHASILYQVIAKEPKPASREKRVKKNKRH